MRYSSRIIQEYIFILKSAKNKNISPGLEKRQLFYKNRVYLPGLLHQWKSQIKFGNSHDEHKKPITYYNCH